MKENMTTSLYKTLKKEHEMRRRKQFNNAEKKIQKIRLDEASHAHHLGLTFHLACLITF